MDAQDRRLGPQGRDCRYLKCVVPAGLRSRKRCFTLYSNDSISNALVTIIQRPQPTNQLRQERPLSLQQRRLLLRLGVHWQ